MPASTPKSSNEVRVVQWNKETAITEQEAEAILRKEGFLPFKWHDVPGSSYPLHRHDHDEWLWIIRGEMSFVIHDQEYTLKAGDRLFLPANTPHTAFVPAARSVTYLIGQRK